MLPPDNFQEDPEAGRRASHVADEYRPLSAVDRRRARFRLARHAATPSTGWRRRSRRMRQAGALPRPFLQLVRHERSARAGAEIYLVGGQRQSRRPSDRAGQCLPARSSTVPIGNPDWIAGTRGHAGADAATPRVRMLRRFATTGGAQAKLSETIDALHWHSANAPSNARGHRAMLGRSAAKIAARRRLTRTHRAEADAAAKSPSGPRRSQPRSRPIGRISTC